MTDGLVLRIEDENLSGGVVIQGKCCAGYIFSALGRLGKSFVGGAIAVYDDARPRSGVRIVALSCERKAGNKKTPQHPNQRDIRSHAVTSLSSTLALFDRLTPNH